MAASSSLVSRGAFIGSTKKTNNAVATKGANQGQGGTAAPNYSASLQTTGVPGNLPTLAFDIDILEVRANPMSANSQSEVQSKLTRGAVVKHGDIAQVVSPTPDSSRTQLSPPHSHAFRRALRFLPASNHGRQDAPAINTADLVILAHKKVWFDEKKITYSNGARLHGVDRDFPHAPKALIVELPQESSIVVGDVNDIQLTIERDGDGQLRVVGDAKSYLP